MNTSAFQAPDVSKPEPPQGLNNYFAETHSDFTRWGVASTICSILLLVTYTRQPDVRKTPGWQFLYSSLCEIYVSLGFVVLSIAGAVEQHGDELSTAVDLEHLVCAKYSTLLLSILGFDVAANTWRLLMYVDLIVVYHNPFRTSTAYPMYHMLVALVATVWVVSISNAHLLCGTDSSSSVNVLTLTWGLVYAPFLLFIVIGGSLYVAVKALLSRDKFSNQISRLTRQRAMQHCMQYLILYGSLLGLLVLGYVGYQIFTARAVRNAFAHITAALTAGRSVFGFFGWIFINREQLYIRSSDEGGPRELGGMKNLLQPLLDSLPGNGAREKDVRTGEQSEAGGRLRSAGFKEELRYELVSDVAIAISELAEREANETSFSPPLPLRDSYLEEVCDDPSQASEPAATPLQQRAQVEHYAVAHFRAIREAFGISAASFATAFRHSLPESQDQARRLRESVSEGASGSFFYWVKHPDGSDTGYIVKQITKTEKDSLMNILPAYKDFVQSRGGNSLLQYLSCHSMRLRWKCSGKVYLVVMRNFFPIRPQLSFDLKGATANRRALKTWELHQSDTVAGLYGTLRDWEWMDIGMVTDIEDSDRQRIWRMICADCDFLKRQQLIDYSLLIGIFRPPTSLLPRQKQTLLHHLARQCRGCAIISHDRQKVYFFGIIDVLEKFTLRWRVQRMVLKFLYAIAMRWQSSDGISAMPPPLYADRFCTFMAQEILHMDEESQLASTPLDESWRDGGCFDYCKRLLRLAPAHRPPRKGGTARWKQLWERRRRGLVKSRIDCEHDDYVARIKELEEHVQMLEYELACSRGVHPSLLTPTLCSSDGGGSSVDF